MNKIEECLNTVITGDCIEVMKQFPAESIDIIVTSPPYNVGLEYEKAQLGYDEYLHWFDDVLFQCHRVLKTGSRICININDTYRNSYCPLHCDIASRMRKYWYMMGIIIWSKGFRLNTTAWGSWQSPSAPNLRSSHEYIIIAGKDGKKLLGPKGEKHEWVSQEFLDYTSELWTFSPEIRKLEHPAPFPEELPKRLIKLYTYKNTIVLDPFIGSGTTGVVARKLGCDFIGIEKEAKYAKYAEKRIQPWIEQQMLKV